MSLAESLERVASALPDVADRVRPANGDPAQLRAQLDPADCGRVLAWLLAHEPEYGSELAESWVDVEDAAAVFGCIGEAELPKAGRKALRRALHRLRSRGIEVSAPEPVARVARLPEISDEIDAGYVSAIDPRGARVVYLVESNPAGGARLFEVLLDELRGLVDFEIYAAGRSRVRRFVREAVARSRFPAVSAPPASVRALIARAAQRHPADRVLPKGFAEWRSRFEVTDAQTPGALAREGIALEGPPEPGVAAPLARAEELLRQSAIGPWPPEVERLVATTGELAENAGEDWSRAAVALFDDQHAADTAFRFEESAYVFWKRDAVDDARACLAAADAFRAGDPSSNPVAGACAELLLAGALESIRARRDSEPGAEPSKAGEAG